MTKTSRFESRIAKLSCNPEDFYKFITNIQNFGQFIPSDAIKNWQATEDHCSFIINPLGEITLGIELKIPYTQVVFKGNALMTNDFSITAVITGNGQALADVRLIFEAELNTLLAGMASTPVQRFLETIVLEMEKFDKWVV
jgi:hypothetical protein